MKLKLLLSICFLTVIHGLNAQHPFDVFFESWSGDPDLKHGSIGIKVMNTNTKGVLFSENADLLLEPASNMKMVSSYAVVDQLGSDYRYTTQLFYTGRISEGVLEGDLVLKGSGDPSFCSKYFPNLTLAMVANQVSKALSERNIHTIKGSVIVDASVWDKHTIPANWNWNDLGNYYGAGAYGFNVSDNLYEIELLRSNVLDTRCNVGKVIPPIKNLSHHSNVKTAAKGSGDQAYIFGAPYQYERYIEGTIPIGESPFIIKGSMPDPALFMAQFLEDRISDAGIKLTNPAWANFDKIQYSNKVELLTWNSPTIAEILDIGNAESVNLFLEAAANTLYQEEGSANLDLWMKDYMDLKGLDCSTCRFDDASGLSVSNSVSANFLIDFFLMAVGSDLSEWFRTSLAVAGERGTMKYMFKNSPAKGKIQAKSGLVQDHRNYTGFVQTKSGQELVFSIMTYHPGVSSRKMTRKLEMLMEAIYLSY